MTENIVPFFQPIINSSTAQVVGHEVLARIKNEHGAPTSAYDVLFSHKRTQSARLASDRLVRMQALEKFTEAGQPGYLTLNISPEWLNQANGKDLFTVDMIKDYGIDTDKIVLEIIETPADNEKLKSTIHFYKDNGIKVAIDDFGAGDSNFDRVINLSPDIIKLDMALFNQALLLGGRAETLIDSVCFMAERMGSEILAEGVESLEGFSYAQKFGAQLMQGYLFSPAVSNFTQTQSFNSHIKQLRKNYVLEEREILNKHRIIRNVLYDQIKQFSQSIKSPLDVNILSLDQMKHPDCMNVYLCNAIGDQVSDIFSFRQGIWQSQTVAVNTNRSCRPYFCKLQSDTFFEPERIANSAPYHDLDSKQLTETLAYRLNDNLTLFLDVLKR